MSAAAELQVTDNPAEGRYEAHVDGDLAGYLIYREQEGGLALVHTEVVAEFEGQGVAGRLVSGVLDDVRDRGLKVTPFCRFASAYIDRHPEYDDLVAN